MRKMCFVYMLLCLCVWPVNGATAVPAGRGEGLSTSARMGSRFRSVDVCVTLPAAEPGTPLYYLALAQHSAAPSAETVSDYIRGQETAGLSDGTAVRGQWIVAAPYDKRNFTLTGGENVARIQGETGFIDGYRYDVYVAVGDMVVVAGSGVMAQPFDAMSADGKCFTIRTARQLGNIQRMADLSTETKGIHGTVEFITNPGITYVLGEDIDLGGENWTPVGNVDAHPKYVFQGSFDGNGHTIRNLRIDKDTERDGVSYGRQGLFGKTEQAAIRNLTIDGARLSIAGDFGKTPFAVGILAGEMIGGTVEHVTVSNAVLTAYGPDTAYGAVGGLAGKAVDTCANGLAVSRSVISAYDEKQPENGAAAVGGIIGHYTAVSPQGQLQGLQTDATVKASPVNDSEATGMDADVVCIGGVLGRLEADAAGEMALHAADWQVSGDVAGGSRTGGWAGLVVYSAEQGPEDAVVFDGGHFTGHVAGYGITGGLFGEVRSLYNRNILIKNADAGGHVMHRTQGNTFEFSAVLGGLAGSMTGCTVSRCLSRGSALSAGEGIVGGFAGMAKNAYFHQSYGRRYVSGGDKTGGFVGLSSASDYQECGVEPARVAGGRHTGGFVGRVEDGTFYDCYSAVSVTGIRGVGGFAGTAQGMALSLNGGHTVLFAGCRADGAVRASEGWAGGFAGSMTYAAAERCGASGAVRANAPEAGGFCGRLTHRSRISNAYADGKVVNTERIAGGFVGMVTGSSCVEYAYAAGDVTGYDEIGGFVGVVTAYGTPNTLTGCLSFANRVTGPAEASPRRFAGQLGHAGVNNCYAYLGSALVAGHTLNAVSPGAFGADGADMNSVSLENVLQKLGWDEQVWAFAYGDEMPSLRRP